MACSLSSLKKVVARQEKSPLTALVYAGQEMPAPLSSFSGYWDRRYPSPAGGLSAASAEEYNYDASAQHATLGGL